jgi:hypothetical protein
MRNRKLHRQLTAIEAKFGQAAKAIEREQASLAERKISVKEAERAYKQFKDSCSKQTRSEDLSKLTLDQLAVQYFREVRRTTLPHRNWTKPAGR